MKTNRLMTFLLICFLVDLIMSIHNGDLNKITLSLSILLSIVLINYYLKNERNPKKDQSMISYIVVKILFLITMSKIISIFAYVADIIVTIIVLTIMVEKNSKNNKITSNTEQNAGVKEIIQVSNFDPIYAMPEDKLIEEILRRELAKSQPNKKRINLIPADLLKKKRILNLIFCFLLFIYISLIFFHFPIYTYLIGLIILIIYGFKNKKYNYIEYLKKELKSRPSEKISNIVMNCQNSLVPNRLLIYSILGIIFSIALPLIIFSNPKIIYESNENGYSVRYYIFGVSNYNTATIPELHNNQKVTSLRGNTFSNMFFLENIVLPDSITEIRGQAFKNCYNLKEVNIPNNLEYLGGGSFYNAESIKKIELPDTLTYLGGESFYNASSLEEIKLSESLTEIRGNTFENCSSLKSIIIPDKVTRIGGHAFYNNKSLEEVVLTENSRLKEIGSSAFRLCSKLRQITLPSSTNSINPKAFKESPTIVKRFSQSETSNYNIPTNSESYSYTLEENGTQESSFYYINQYSYNNNLILINKNSLYFSADKIQKNTINGYIRNNTNQSESFILKVNFYTQNNVLIGNCQTFIKTPTEINKRKLFKCQMPDNENQFKEDIYLYKITIENYTRG